MEIKGSIRKFLNMLFCVLMIKFINRNIIVIVFILDFINIVVNIDFFFFIYVNFLSYVWCSYKYNIIYNFINFF